MRHVKNLINWLFRPQSGSKIPQEFSGPGKYKILFFYRDPLCGKSLLKLTHNLTKKTVNNTSITAMHLAPPNDLNQYDLTEYEKESIKPIIEESFILNRQIMTLFRASKNTHAEIIELANNGKYDLLLEGFGQYDFEDSSRDKILGFNTPNNKDYKRRRILKKEHLSKHLIFDKNTQEIIDKSKISVGIFIDKNYTCADNVIILVYSRTDSFLIDYAQKLIHNASVQVTFIDVDDILKNIAELDEKIKLVEQAFPDNIKISQENIIDKEFLKTQDLMLVSMESYHKLIRGESLWMSNIPSTLVIKQKN